MSNLSFKFFLKMGISSVVERKGRFILTTVLFVFTFLLFGLSLTIASVSERDCKEELITKTSFTVGDEQGALTEEAYRSLVDETGIPFFLGVISGGSFIDYSSYSTYKWAGKEEELKKTQFFSTVAVTMTEEQVVKAGGSLTGRLPEKETEIAISNCALNNYIYFGYKNGEELEEVSSASDMIGKTLGIWIDGEEYPVEVVGIVWSDCEQKHASQNYDIGANVNDKLFVSEETLKKLAEAEYGEGYCAMIAYASPTEKKSAEKLMNYAEETSFIVQADGFSDIEERIEQLTPMMKIFTIAGVCLLFFSALLVIQFISISLSDKKTEIGILRALGMTKSDVLRIFTTESFLIGVATAIFACVLLGIGIGVANHILYSVLMSAMSLPINIPVFILCAILAIVFPVLASMYPIIKEAKKSPVDAIRENRE